MKKLISLVLMLVAISHATAQGPTSTKVLSDFGNSSTPLRTEKQIVEDSTSNDVTPSDSSNYDVASPSLVADATNVYTFKLTTSITSGRYMIVASDKKKILVMQPLQEMKLIHTRRYVEQKSQLRTTSFPLIMKI